MIDEKQLLKAVATDGIKFQVEFPADHLHTVQKVVAMYQAKVLELINNQPKVREWIKCADRLPTMEECQENDCRFIATDGNRTYERHFNYLEKNWLIIGDMVVVTDKCVKAWCPLPKRYKEDVSE